MNTYLVTLAAGGTATVNGENYNGVDGGALTIIDQFGATIKTYTAGTWTDIAIVNPSASPAETASSTAYQPIITASNPSVQGTYEAGNTTFTGGA